MSKNSITIGTVLISLIAWLSSGMYAQAHIATYYRSYGNYIYEVDKRLDIYAKKKRQKALDREARRQQIMQEQAEAIAAARARILEKRRVVQEEKVRIAAQKRRSNIIAKNTRTKQQTYQQTIKIQEQQYQANIQKTSTRRITQSHRSRRAIAS